MKCVAKCVSFGLALWAAALFAASGWIMHDPQTFGPNGIGGQLLSKIAAPGVIGYYMSGVSQFFLLASVVCLAGSGLMKYTPPQFSYTYGSTEPPPVRRFAKV